MSSSQHPVLSLPFSVRADLPNTPPLASYLLHLISIKRSNLCISADVHSTSALLRLAEEVGDSICVLKTHADIVDDFSERTIRGLNEISRRKRFLLFEDRKFGDIGNTVQSQYTRGPFSIATWAHLTNAHLLPGPAIIHALHSAATTTLTSLNHNVSTEISIGTPCQSSDDSENGKNEVETDGEDSGLEARPLDMLTRKGSVVKATTIISQTYEPSPPHPGTFSPSLSASEPTSPRGREKALQELGPPPHARGLLLLAEMSSEGNLVTQAYTSACVSAARSHSEFVLGFISQHCLNLTKTDNFLNFTPGINFPPEIPEQTAEKEPAMAKRGDGLGQKWQSPREVIVGHGADVIIVGRGVLKAKDRGKEAERYRKAAWEAYEERIGRSRWVEEV